MLWWQVVLTVGVPWVLHGLWNLAPFKKTPKAVQSAIEGAVKLGVDQAIQSHLEQGHGVPAAPRPGKK